MTKMLQTMFERNNAANALLRELVTYGELCERRGVYKSIHKEENTTELMDTINRSVAESRLEILKLIGEVQNVFKTDHH